VVGASPLSADLDGIRRLEEAGAAAVVLPSLFEEQIRHESLEIHRMLSAGADSSAEAHGYFPDLADYDTGPDRYLRLIRSARETIGIPIVASLNCVSGGGWTRYAAMIEDAGAHAL